MEYRVYGCGTFRGRRISPFITLKTTAFAPMAMARLETAVIVKPGVFRGTRMLNSTS
jgi:hypothetical protein